MKASRIFIYAVVLWASVSCENARRLEKSLDVGERGSNLTQEQRQEVIQHFMSEPTTTSERAKTQETTSNFIRDIPSIPEDSNIQSLKNDDQVQVSYNRKLTIDKDSSEDSANSQNKSVNSVKTDVISYKFNKTGPSSYSRTDMHISHTAYEHSSSSLVYDEEYEENNESITKENQPVVSSTEESKVDLEKKIFEAKKKEKSKKEILDSGAVPSDYNGPGRIEKPYKDNSFSIKLKEKNKDSITEALDDRRSTTVRISTSSDISSNKSIVSEHDNKPLDSLDIFKIVSSGTTNEDSVNQSVNSVIYDNGVNNEFKKNRVKYSLKKAHENVNNTEADNSSTNGNILNKESAGYLDQAVNLDFQVANSNVQNGAVELPERERIIVPFQHQHQTESTPTKLDIFGKPPLPQSPSPTPLVKPSLAFKQQLANKIKGLETVSPTGSSLTIDSVDETVEKTTGKSSTKGGLKKKPKTDHLHSSSEMNIPPTATAWTLVSMKTAAEGLSTLKRPVSASATDLPSTTAELLTKVSVKYTTIPPVSRVKSFVPWSTRLQRTTKPLPTVPSIDIQPLVNQANALTDASTNSDKKYEQISTTEKLPSPTTEQQSVIRTTMELDRNMTETSVNLIQSSLNDVMVKDQSSTVPQEKSSTTQSPSVETIVVKNFTALEEESSNILQNKSFDSENIIDIRQPDNFEYINETKSKSQDTIEETPLLVKNTTINEVLTAVVNENVNEVRSENSENNFNITSTRASPNQNVLEKEKMKSNSEFNDFDQGGSEFDGAEEVKSNEESDEEEKPKQITTVPPLIENFETTITPDLDEEEGENEREEDESLSLHIENNTPNKNKTELLPLSLNETVIEIKPISSTSTPTEFLATNNSSYVSSFDIISKDNTTQIVTKSPTEGDKNWYEIEPKSASNTTEVETSPKKVYVEITTAPSIDTTYEPEAITEETKEDSTIPPEIIKTVPASSTATTLDAVTLPENEEDSQACVGLHVITSQFKLCHSQQQIKENIAAQLANKNVSWDQVMVMAKELEGCQMKLLSDEEEELKVYVCFLDKNQEPSLMIRNEFVKRKENSPSINFDDVGVSTVQPGVMEEGIDNVLAAIILSVIAAVCLVLLGILLVIVRKRQGRFNYGQRCTPVSLDDYSLDNISVYNNSVRRNKGAMRASKRSYGNPAFDDPGGPSHPINFAGLANFSNDREALDEEFNQIPVITVKPDELPPGAESKNRYANVIPLPETRVVLQVKDGKNSVDDYINANFIKGTKAKEKLYIACQAPLQTTVEDFWKMVWQQQTKVILMLTALNEKGVEKCADYLPQLEVSDCHRLFGDFQVTLKNHEVREKYIISTLQLKNLETNSWREVTHLWYSSWPAQGVPDDGSAMIAFLIEARSYMRGAQGPTAVHCSPGTGRTGTVIAIDLCIRDFETQRSVDIPRTVYALRRSRAGAVQTKDQYAFIYQVLNLYATKLTGGALDSI